MPVSNLDLDIEVSWWAKRTLRGQLTVAKLLLDCGSQVNAANATQTTALHWAARRSLEDLLELLPPGDMARRLPLRLSAGATPRAATLQGDTPLHDAAANATAAVLRRLLAAGARAEANQQGQTPLHVAAFNGRLEACQVAGRRVRLGRGLRSCWKRGTAPRTRTRMGIRYSTSRRSGTMRL